MDSDINKLNRQIWNLTKPCLISLKTKALGINLHICDNDSSVKKLMTFYLGYLVGRGTFIDQSYVAFGGEDKRIRHGICEARDFVLHKLNKLSSITLRQQCLEIIKDTSHKIAYGPEPR